MVVVDVAGGLPSVTNVIPDSLWLAWDEWRANLVSFVIFNLLDDLGWKHGAVILD